MELESSNKNTFCIQYWKPLEPGNKKVLKRINKNGTPVSAKKYSDVFFYANLKDAIPQARELMENGYDIKVRKCCLGKNDNFWLI